MKRIILLLLALAAISCASAAKKEDTAAVPKSAESKEKEVAVVAPTAPSPTEDKKIEDRKIEDKSFDEVGYCSWYGEQFQNKPTASGEPFDKVKLTAAHRTLPFGSEVRVQNLDNKKETIVRINDRGPFNKARIIDVSEKAAEELDFKQAGVTKVGLMVLKRGESSKVVKDEDFSIDDEDDDDDDDLDDEDTMTPPKKEEKPKPSNPTTPNEKKAPPTPVKPAITDNKKPVTPAPAKEKETPAATSSEVQPKGFSVQIGVFKDKRRADNFKTQIKSSFKDSIYMFNRSGTYVVQIGDFANRNDAVILRDKLKDKGFFGFIPPK